MYIKILPFLVFYLFLLQTNLTAADKDPIDTFIDLISKSVPMLEGSVKVKKTVTDASVKFCPDNTCDIIRAPSNTNTKGLNDFSYLYFFYASGYTYLAISANQSLPFIQSGSKLAKEIIHRNADKCDQTNELEQASCVLNNLASENKIQLFFSRFDEGENVESKKDITETLSVRSLEKVRKWLYKHCKSCQQRS